MLLPLPFPPHPHLVATRAVGGPLPPSSSPVSDPNPPAHVHSPPQGNRDTIDSLPGGSQKVMTQVLKLIDAHDLYGSVAYPKHHTQADISDIYQFSMWGWGGGLEVCALQGGLWLRREGGQLGGNTSCV